MEVKYQVIRYFVIAKFISNFACYYFPAMCDFQYLPVYREASGEPQQCLIDKIIPVGGDDINFIK